MFISKHQFTFIQSLTKISPGFTLFETLIYIALFSFIMSGTILSAYQIFEGSAQVQKMTERETEINFVLRKLNWLVTGDIVNASGNKLIVDLNSKQYTVDLVDDVVTLDNLPLNTRISVSELNFNLSEENPKILTIELTVDEEQIGPIKHYVRKN